jgi:hypothetical protein
MQDGLGGGDRHDEIGANEGGVDAKRDRAGNPDLDEILALGVMHFDVAVKASRELRGDQCLELLVTRAPCEPARDEQCLVAGRNAQPFELGNGRSDCTLAWVALCARQWQVRRLDEDRRARPARHERFERIAGEREAKRVAYCRAHVRDGVLGRRRLQDDRIVVSRHDDEPRPGEQRDPRHGRPRVRAAPENG